MDKSEAKKIADILHELDMRAAIALNECRLDDALNIYNEILNAQQKLRLEKFSGHTLLNIANIHMAREEYDEALEYINKASGLKSIQKSDEDSGNIVMFKANCLYSTNKKSEAEKTLLQELKRNKNRTACGKIQLLLYSYYMDAKNNSKARGTIDNAINNFKIDGNNEELIRALNCRADYFSSIGQNLYAQLDKNEISKLLKEA